MASITITPPSRLLFDASIRREAYRGLVPGQSLDDRDLLLIELGFRYAMSSCNASDAAVNVPSLKCCSAGR